MGGLSDYNNGAAERRFSPYSDNGGSVVAIAGADFCVIASDTRLSGHGYAILSREQPKLFKLSETTVLGSTGCWCDILTFCKVADMRLKSYKHNHNKVMSTSSTARGSSRTTSPTSWQDWTMRDAVWCTAMIRLDIRKRPLTELLGAPCLSCSLSWIIRLV